MRPRSGCPATWRANGRPARLPQVQEPLLESPAKAEERRDAEFNGLKVLVEWCVCRSHRREWGLAPLRWAPSPTPFLAPSLRRPHDGRTEGRPLKRLLVVSVATGGHWAWSVVYSIRVVAVDHPGIRTVCLRAGALDDIACRVSPETFQGHANSVGGVVRIGKPVRGPAVRSQVR